jgi:uncharacterized repeat protein (TIGR02543 family)
MAVARCCRLYFIKGSDSMKKLTTLLLTLVSIVTLSMTTVFAANGDLEWESANYGGSIRALAVDDTYVYVGGSDTQTVQALDKVDGSLEWESADYGGSIRALAVDDTYVYVGGSDTQTVQALDKVDGSLEWESANYGGSIRALAVDDTYVYVGGSTTQTVQALDKVDGSLEWESADYGGSIYALAVDDTYVYVGGHTTQTVQALDKVDGSLEWESADYGGVIYALAVDDTYVYVGGFDTQTVQALDKVDGSLEWSSPDYGGIIYALSVDDTYVYVGGSTTQTVQALETDGSMVLYTVTYDSNGGSAVTPEEVKDGNLATEPPDPTRDGYAFVGWFTDDDTFLVEWDFDTDTVTDDLTLYADWEELGMYCETNEGSLINLLPVLYVVMIISGLATFMFMSNLPMQTKILTAAIVIVMGLAFLPVIHSIVDNLTSCGDISPPL